MMRALLVAASLFVATLAHSDECMPAAAALAQMAKMQAGNIRHLDKRGLASATEIYNNQPPESDDEFDAALIADLPNGGGLISMERGGQSCGRVAVQPEAWAKIVVTLEGQGV